MLYWGGGCRDTESAGDGRQKMKKCVYLCVWWTTIHVYMHVADVCTIQHYHVQEIQPTNRSNSPTLQTQTLMGYPCNAPYPT
jgi:hypothetical protein